MSRNRVYVQVKNQSSGRWGNYTSKPTYDEAVCLMKELNQKYPDAIFRVLDNNLVTHSRPVTKTEIV